MKTDREIGTEEEVKVGFFSAEEHVSGGVFIRISPSAQYHLWYCLTWRYLPADLPSSTDKVWRITLSRSPAEIRLVIHCNDREVLNMPISDSTCKNNGAWYQYWGYDVEKIEFVTDDTASDYFQLPPFPGYYHL